MMLADPGRNPIDDAILFKSGTAEFCNAYKSQLSHQLEKCCLSIDLTRFKEDDYFELKETYERMLPRLESD